MNDNGDGTGKSQLTFNLEITPINLEMVIMITGIHQDGKVIIA